MPELTLVVKAAMIVLVLLLIVTIFGYHVSLDRLIARSRARTGAEPPKPAGKEAGLRS